MTDCSAHNPRPSEFLAHLPPPIGPLCTTHSRHHRRLQAENSDRPKIKQPVMMNRALNRPSTMAVARSLLLLVSYLPALHSRPTTDNSFLHAFDDDDDGGFPAEPIDSPEFWWKLGVSVILVLLGGVFAGAFPKYRAFQVRGLMIRTDVGVVKSG
jgi:hypothetical protein